MKCKVCGKELPSDAKFCTECGSVVEQGSNEHERIYEQTIIEDNNSGAGSDDIFNIGESEHRKTVYCSNCGKPLDPNVQFCLSCGVRVGGNHQDDYEPKKVNFVEAFKSYWKNYFKFSGRASRSEYWYVILWIVIVTLVTSFLQEISGYNDWYDALQASIIDPSVPIPELTAFGIISAIIAYSWALATLIPSLAIAVRRLHDIGKSGWWILLELIPIVGAIILFVYYCFPSQPTRNQYDE